MPAVVIVGGQWGDEGKGKIVDLLAEKAQVVARYSGGANAGHTVINQFGQFGLHLVPSGIFNAGTTCLIGNGVVLDPAVLFQEIDTLQKAGVDTSRLFVSERAHLVMPYHLLIDSLEEEGRGSGAIGTTRRGIGPAYTDKVARLGIRTGDLLDKAAFLERLRLVVEIKNRVLTRVYGVEPLSLEEIYQKYCDYGERLAPRLCQADLLAQEALDRGQVVLLEGAQGTMLDIDFGTYPYVTSSSPVAGGACIGLGLGPWRIKKAVGVFKAYTTRVGGGPMPTELKDSTGEAIRERGHEYGTTTGRPRRCGWFDAVAARFSARLNGFTSIALTRLDVLDALPRLKICTAYLKEGRRLESFPPTLSLLAQCQPIYEELEGWQQPTSEARSLVALPSPAQRYVKRLEEILSCPIGIISVGPRREQSILARPVL